MAKKFFHILLGSLLFTGLPYLATGQTTAVDTGDAFYIRRIFDQALTNGSAYAWLTHLTKQIGGRLAGSAQAAAAVEYTRQMLDSMGLDTVYLQACVVPRWIRGEPEQVRIVNSSQVGTVDLHALALGNSVGTGPRGLTAEVVEVKSLDEVDRLGRQALAGKIVFFNRPLDPRQLNTFAAYGGAVDQRGAGAARAAAQGAVAVLVRSMTTSLDHVPHTGGTSYQDGVEPIPAVAISTLDADLLSRLLEREAVRVYVRTTCEMLSPVVSYNVIGEIRGSTRPEEIILVGGHLDSWDVGEGAHDDGAGCVQSMDVLQLLRRLNYRPQRTLRCVLFMNEENGLAGGRAYWKASNEQNEYHLAAIESDRGGFTPRGFTCDAHESVFTEKFARLGKWLPLLEPYGLSFRKGGSGADISGLKSQRGMLFGYDPDSQRYFDYHHTPIDRLETVNRRELELGVASMTALVYLLDRHGL